MVVWNQIFGGNRMETGGILIGWLGILTQILAIAIILQHDFLLYFFNSRLPGILFMVISVIQVLACILLLIGISKNKPNLILPWLIIKFHIYLVLIFLAIFGLIKFFKLVSVAQDICMLTTLIVLLAIYCGFCIYSWLLMLALYQRVHALRAEHYNTIRTELLFASYNDLPYIYRRTVEEA